MAAYVPGVSDTGIFFSTDPRTAMYTSPASPTISTINGYAARGGMTTHNLWDSQMVVAYSGAARIATVGCPLVSPWVATMGAGPVAGRDTVLKNDYTGGTGPWQRISYPGSYYGTMTGTVGTYLGCVGGVPTSAGWALSSSNPLPASTNAVRFAAGRVTVGELFSVRITLKITQPLPIIGLINNTEVFGGDTSVKAPGTLVGKDVVWKYHIPNVANADTTLTVVKRVIGMCAGVGCVPQSFSGGAVPTLANLKLRYEITYLNSSGGPQTAVSLSDILPAGFTLVAGSEVVVTGPNILPTIPVAGGFAFQTLASLGSGSGGTVRFDVSTVAAPAVKTVISNTAKLVSLSLPGGVQSVATVSPTNTASVTMNVSTSTPTSAPGGTANYAVSLSNNGAAGATLGPLVANGGVVFTLPSSGGTLPEERFGFKSATGTMCGVTTLLVNQACGVLTTPGVGAAPATTSYVVMAVTGNGVATGLAPYTGLNREQITLIPTVLTTIPVGGRLDVTFGANVGTSVASSTVGYTSDVVVTYGGGFVTAPGLTTMSTSGVAPVKIDIPLSVTVAIDCVYSGVTCVAYTGGSIPSNSKIKYRLDYKNTGTAQTNVVLTNTLPTNTSFVAGTANTATQPTTLGQVLTFPTITSLASGATGSVTFDVQLGALVLSGSYITNAASIKSDVYVGGASGSLTTTVDDSANLVVTQTTTTPTLVKCTAVNVPAGCGQASYRITVKNTGNTGAGNIIVNELLPFTGTVANITTRFNFTALSTQIAGMTAVVPTLVGPPPTMLGYTTNLNQQQVVWNFTGQTLAPGATLTIDYKADAGTGLTAGNTEYTSSAIVNYTAGPLVGSTALTAAALNTAPVTIPTNLVVTTSIDCIYDALGACNAYTGTGVVPTAAKVRYKMHYQNTSASAKSNVYLCGQLTSSIAPALTATFTTPTVAPTPVGPFTNTPALALPAAPVPAAAVACGFVAPVAPATAVTFNYPVIATLAAGASGDVYFDAQTNGAAGATLTLNGAMAVSALAAGPYTERETSSTAVFVQNAPVLSITKATTTPGRKPGEVATYSITIKNTGNVPTTSLKVYDFLPFSGTTVDANKRFTWTANGTISCVPAAGCPVLPAPTATVPPAFSPFSNSPNQQQVLWDFGAYALAVGSSMTFTFTATAGAPVSSPTFLPAGNYNNSVKADFTYLQGVATLSGSYSKDFTDTSDRIVVATALADIVLTNSNGVSSVAAATSTTYSIVVTNNGPDSVSGTVLNVPIATGLNKTAVSCTSANFSCPLVTTIAALEGAGITLNPLNSGQSATITVTADVTALSGSVTSTATVVLPAGMMDSTSATPLTVSDTDSVLVPDLSTSTLTVVDSNGGSHDVLDVMTYTVTLTETAGVVASNVTVTAPIPANTTTLTVVGALPAGASLCATNSATNFAVCGVTVPANGTVTLKYSVAISNAPAPAVGTLISSTATIQVPSGFGASPSTSFTVGTPATNGMKALYLYGSDAATGLAACSAAVPCKMSRTPTPVTAPSNTVISIPRNTLAPFTWNLSPALQLPVMLDPAISATVPVSLNIAGMRPGNNRTYNVLVELYCSNAVPVGVAPISQQLPVVRTGGAAPIAAPFALPLAAATTCPATFNWVLRVSNIGAAAVGRDIIITPAVAAVAPATVPTYSTVSLPSKNVVNVDSVTTYNAAYGATTTSAYFGSGQAAYVRAVVSDPFGSFDITSARLALSTPSGTLTNLLAGTVSVAAASPTVTGVGTSFTTQLVVGDVIAIGGAYYTVSAIASNTSLTLASNVATAGTGLSVNKPVTMTMVADSGTSTKTFEYAYTVQSGDASGIWNAAVIGVEGTEGSVKHSRSGGFEVKQIDHYEISVPANSLTCLGQTVTVTACATNTNPCDSVATGVGTLSNPEVATLTTDKPAAVISNAGLVGGVGTATLSYPLATDGTQVLVSITTPPVPATRVPTCNTTCTTTFNNEGFIFSDSKGSPAGPNIQLDVPAQVSGIASTGYYLRALKRATNSLNCVAGLSGNTSVDFAYECNNPTTCSTGNLMDIGTTAIAGFDNGSMTNFWTPTFTAVPMTFDSNGNSSSPFTINYKDVGLVTLHARTTSANGAKLQGSTNQFVVAPHHFGISAVTAGPIKAGNNFGATVTSYNGLATPTATENFGKENTPEGVSVSFSKCKPTGTNSSSGTFAGTVVGPFVAGAASSTNLNWSEVGNGDLIATLTSGSYLASGKTATGNTSTGSATGAVACSDAAGNVGAFIPDHFNTTVTDGCSGCGFTYSGQPFSVTVTAMNKLGGTTINYDGTVNTTPNFAHDVTLSDASGIAGKFGVSTSPLGVAVGTGGASLIVPLADFSQGVATLTSVPTFTFNAALTAPSVIKLRAVDATVTSSTYIEGVTEIRSGRIKVSNAYGSELLPLRNVPVTVQYYDPTNISCTSGWCASTTDKSTTFDPTKVVSNIVRGLSGTSIVPTAAPLTTQQITDGCVDAAFCKGARLIMLANSAKVSGVTNICLSSPTYLQGSPACSTGTAGPNSGQATFGIYAGKQPFIYLRESY